MRPPPLPDPASPQTAISIAPHRGDPCLRQHLGLKPLLDLEMRLGEGTGAALAMSFAEISVRILMEMATFTEAGVAEKGE